jgi:ribosomal protein S27AE
LNVVSGRHSVGRKKGYQVSDETRKKLSEISPELREQRRQAQLGRTASDETKQKLSCIAKGNINKANRICRRCGAGPFTLSEVSNHRRWHCNSPDF